MKNMKKLYYMMAALAIAMTGCNDQTEILTTEPETTIDPVALTIQATTDGAVTRTQLSQTEGKYSMVWSTDDEIAVVHKTLEKDVAQLFSLSDGAGTTTATFTDESKVKNGLAGTGTNRSCAADQPYYVGYYPASAFYTWREANGSGRYVFNTTFSSNQPYSSTGPVNYPMVAFTTNVNNMKFEGLASVLQLNISSSLTDYKVKHVLLSGTNGLAGYVGGTVSAQNTLEGINYSALDHNITVDCSSSPVALTGTAQPFYAQIIPGNQSNLTIKVILEKDGDSNQYFASFSASGLNFEAKHMYPINLNITQAKTDKSAEPIRGIEANGKLKALAGTNNWNAADENIKQINFIPNSAAKGEAISTSESAFPVYASYTAGVLNITTLGPEFTLGSDCERFFYYLAALEEINGLEYVDTQAVESFEDFFSGCINLKTLDLSHFDTSSATNMTGMFSNCESLSSLDVSNFKTEKVTEMTAMFQKCSSLTTLDLRKFNVLKVTDFFQFFYGCTNLQNIYMPQMLKSYTYMDGEEEKSLYSDVDWNAWNEVRNSVYGGKMSQSMMFSGLAEGKTCTFHCKNDIDKKILEAMKSDDSYGFGTLKFEVCTHTP